MTSPGPNSVDVRHQHWGSSAPPLRSQRLRPETGDATHLQRILTALPLESEAPVTVLSSPPSIAPAPVQGHASGPTPYRALVVGAGAIADGDEVGLADALATDLAASTGLGVDVELVAAAPLADARTGRLLGERDLSRIDALIVVLDPAHAPDDAVRPLLEDLSARLTPGSALVAVVPPPRATDLAARDLDRFTAAVEEAAGALTPVVRLDDLRGSASGERATLWASAIADAASGAMIEPMVRFLSNDPFDEFLRVDSVRAVGRRYAEWVDTFQDLVDAARTTYGTPSAAMSIIDDETTRYFTRSGNVAESLPRGKTVCNRVMRIFGGLILGDARLDHRFSGLPEVKTGDVRFYAGYRITGPDGAPFGALCVFDSEPREVRDEDLTALRDLALDAQRRLHAVVRTS